jgi:hypothetical protein
MARRGYFWFGAVGRRFMTDGGLAMCELETRRERLTIQYTLPHDEGAVPVYVTLDVSPGQLRRLMHNWRNSDFRLARDGGLIRMDVEFFEDRSGRIHCWIANLEAEISKAKKHETAECAVLRK